MIPYQSQFYQWMRQENQFERAHIRWILFELSFMAVLLICMLLFLFFGEFSQLVFIIIFGFSSLSMMYIRKIGLVQNSKNTQ